MLLTSKMYANSNIPQTLIRYALICLLGTLAACSANQAVKDEALNEHTSELEAVPNETDQPVVTDTLEENALADIVEPEIDLWQRVRSEFSWEIPDDKRVQQEFKWYMKHPEYLDRVATRGARYLFHIMNEIEARDLPHELALLPIVESAYDPFAYSPSRASGMWQIIPGTAKMLGVKQTWWYDGRRDITVSTDAALRYLVQLNKQFDGDWLHALAAYNSGAGRVRRAIRQNKAKGLPTDFWNLKLPRETRSYVPRLLALAKIFTDPAALGVTIQIAPNEAVFGEVHTHSQIDLAQVAAISGLTMDEIYALNPGFNRWASDPEGPHTLLVPIEKQSFVQEKLAAIPEDQRVTWERYRIQSGDSLSTIAQRYGVTVRSLKAINNLQSSRIRAGKTLLVPTAAAAPEHYSRSVDQRLAKKQNAGLSSGKNRIEYTVKSGDSLWSISRRFGTSSSRIASWNDMATRDPIKPGQKLVIWSNKGLNKTHAPNTTASNGVVRKVSYRVRQGDSLHRIADKFRVNVKDIMRWNSLNPKKYLQPGQAIVLFVDVTKS